MTTRKHAFYGILALVTLLGLAITQSAKANYIVTMQQVGSNVVANGSGAFNLTGLTFEGSGTPTGIGVVANTGIIFIGVIGNVDSYSGFTGPPSFGNGGFVPANTSSGDFVAIRHFPDLIFVPAGYVSGTLLSDSLTFNNRNFASLGVSPGTYVWSWGTGANQNFTLQIGVPDTGSTLPLLGFASLGLVALRRKLRC